MSGMKFYLVMWSLQQTIYLSSPLVGDEIPSSYVVGLLQQTMKFQDPFIKNTLRMKHGIPLSPAVFFSSLEVLEKEDVILFFHPNLDPRVRLLKGRVGGEVSGTDQQQQRHG